jgi:hypothetical protein
LLNAANDNGVEHLTNLFSGVEHLTNLFSNS